MNTLFLSDIHLCSAEPNIATIFLNFLQKEAIQADAIYILGDLFEVWIGDDDTNEFNLKIIKALHTITSNSIPVYFMHGNRDFLIGEQFADATGCRLIKDPTLINLYGSPTLLTHGDMLCIDDLQHMRFRKLINKQWIKRLLLTLPLSIRKKIAQAGRDKSKKNARLKDSNIMDVNLGAVKKLMQQYQATTLIHGHTHQPSIQYFVLDKVLVSRFVLSDWHNHGSILICQSNGERYLTTLTI